MHLWLGGALFVLALLLDVVCQYIVAKFVYPGEALVVALLLAILPYLVVRGLVTCIARNRRSFPTRISP